jgi:TnpA family transposase
MSAINILTKKERTALERPPLHTKSTRAAAFVITKEVRLALRATKEPISKIGFVLQLGYLKSGGKFYAPSDYRKRDIQYVSALLEQDSVDIVRYSQDTAERHRKKILELADWTYPTDANFAEMTKHAARFIENKEAPKSVLAEVCDLCWKRQWIVPSYSKLAELISEAYRKTQSECLAKLRECLSDDEVEELEYLIRADTSTTGIRGRAPISQLKRLNHSMKVSAIRETVKALSKFKNYHSLFKDTLSELALSDKATDFYATWLSKADHQQLMQFKDRYNVYLHMLAFVKHQYYLRQDSAIDLLLKSVASIRQAANSALNELKVSQHEAMSRALDTLTDAHMSVSTFANAVVQITKAPDATPNQKYYQIESLVNEYLELESPSHQEIVDKSDPNLWKGRRDSEYFHILERLSLRMQNRVAGIVKTVDFDESSSDRKLLAAIQHFQETRGKVSDSAPVDFLTDDEYSAVYSDDGLRVSLYKALLFLNIAQSIKAGRLSVKHSYRYRAVDDYLIDRIRWQQDKSAILAECNLVEFADIETVFGGLRAKMKERYKHVNVRLLNGQNEMLTIRSDGRPSVRTPPTNYSTESAVSSILSAKGIIPIQRVLKAVDDVCDITGAFEHHSPTGSKAKPAPGLLKAGLLALGCNIGVGKLSSISTGLDTGAFKNTVNWYFNEGSLQEANRRIISAIDELAIPEIFRSRPDVLHSSSDGRKLDVDVDCIHASYSYKYFGKGQGVTDYTFVDDRHVLFHSTVFSAADREAPYVVDGLLDNEVAMEHIHSTDTHGYTEQIFGATHLLGVSFAPRLARLHKQVLYGVETRRTLAKRGYKILPSRSINWNLIRKHWEDILRFIATIKTRHATASQLFKRLSSYAIDNPLYKALKEFGRIIKTLFLLTYLDDLELRQQIQKQLNRVELANKFSSAVWFDNDEAFQVSSVQQQRLAMLCKQVLQNSIVLWNYLTVSQRVDDISDPEERKSLLETIGQGSMMVWKHVNLRGEYDFTERSLGDGKFDFRRLRSLRID